MNLSDLHPPVGQKHSKKRVGRGMGSGLGKTSGRGHKGARAVSGYSIMRGFEGGQMPLHRRLPKRGFNNIHRVEFKVFNLGQIEQLSEKYNIKEFSLENLYVNGLVNQNDKVKILGNGELKGKFTFKVNAVSEKAKSAIEASGGSVEIVK